MSLPTNQVTKINCKQNAVRAIRFNFDGNYCLTCGADKSVRLWNPLTGTLLQTYTGHGYEVLDAQGSCDNGFIASAGMDKVVFLWDVMTSQAVRRYRGHAGYINAVRFNEESTVVLSASVDGSIRAWDCRSKSRDPIQVIKEAKDTVTSLCISNYEIASSSMDYCLRRYDLRVGKLFQDDLGTPLTNVSFTKDGGCILTSSLDNAIRLIDKESGEILSKYTGHKNENYRIDSCLSETDSYIVSGSEEGLVYFWDLIEGEVKTKLEHVGHKVVHSVSYHPTKAILLTAAEAYMFVWMEPSVEQNVEEEPAS